MSRPVAIVTGSSAGIGAATALRFAEGGFNVVVNYSRDPKPAEEVAAACKKAGAEVEIVKADISDDASCRALAATVEKRWGAARALVNNAGTTKFVAQRDLDGLTADDFLKIYSVNVVGAYQMSRAFAPLLRKEKGGAIVNVSSIAAVMGRGSSIAYMASKGALNTLTMALARALGPDIRVNGVGPGMIESDWLKNGYGAEAYEAMGKHYRNNSALEATIAPRDVAETIYALATAFPKTTGETVLVDAGFRLQKA
ncbi:MAG: SDR family oxidoreductase [Hyphomicrobiales bacterium]|nr:SDR family oxidoreductase [Hyphomicrobiales bacterium]